MSRRLPACFFAVTMVLVYSLQGAEPVTYPVVPTFERFFSEGERPLQGGRLLIGELGCLGCHKSSGQSPVVTPKQAPILDDVAARVKPEHLLKYIADPQRLKPGTTMPNLFAGKSREQAADEVDAIVHYLQSLRTRLPEQAYATTSGRVSGEALYHRAGCAVCHGERRQPSTQLKTSKPLGNLADKYTLVSLAGFLRDPHKTRPSGRMPSLNLTSREANDLASFLLPKIPAKAGITWELYKGRFQKLPDFSKLKPSASGETEVIHVKVGGQKDNFALRFQGVLPIDREGEYTFFTDSDDGSKLYINDKEVVNNDGVHPGQLRSGKIKLKPARYRVTVEFFEAGGGEHCRVDYQGPGIKRQRLAPALMASKPQEPLEDLSFTVDKAKAARGKALFSSVGCASCHSLKDGEQTVVSTRTAPAFERLPARGGCLQPAAESGLPDYGLTKSQQKALARALSLNLKKTKPPTTAEKIDHSMATFNCYACHRRGELGGAEQERIKLFQTTQPEMGIEGSVPPSLDRIGAKLTSLWFKNILANGAKDRPYMYTRMPKFGERNVGHLAAKMASIDTIKRQPPKLQLAATRDVKRAGWEMVGGKGFSCIKCHTFGRYRATGVQSIDMVVMTKRLRKEWFRSYVMNPISYRRGTRMPSAWPPAPNKSLLPKILDGDSDKQILAVWHYLSDGVRARTPAGLVSNSMELIPAGEAIIYRNFIQGAGHRAIGVGYPEAINLALDANELKLAMIWKGAFIDASKHWVNRGQGAQTPAGSSVQKFAAGVDFAVLKNPADGWPSQPARQLGYRFRGYRLSPDRRPTFLYQIGGFRIEDFPNPIEEGVDARLVRTIKVTSGDKDKILYYRAAVGKIAKEDKGFRVGDVQIQITSAGDPVIRGNALLVPMKVGDTLTQTYRW